MNCIVDCKVLYIQNMHTCICVSYKPKTNHLVGFTGMYMYIPRLSPWYIKMI